MASIKWAFGWLGRGKYKTVLALVCVCVSTYVMTLGPRFFQKIIDDVLTGGQYDQFFPLLGRAMLCGIVFMVLRYFISILCEQASQSVVFKLKRELFTRIMQQSPTFFRRNRSGDLIAKNTADVDIIRHFICWVFPRWLECFVMVTFVLAVFMSINAVYALCLFALTPFTLIFSSKLAKRIRPAYGEAREKLSELNTVVQENIGGNRVVKAFTREEFEIEKFSEANLAYKEKNVRANAIWLKYGPMIESVAQMLTVVNLLAGGIMVITGNITIGELNIFLSLSWALNEPMNSIGPVVNDTQRFFASAEKVMELCNSRNSLVSPENPYVPDKVAGNIILSGVYLKYGFNTVLHNINMDIKAGQTIGIIGPTGSGKTSLVNLIARFLDPAEGEVKLDGVSVRDYGLQTLRRNIAITMWDVFLFSDTVESNIAYGVPDADMDIIYKSADIADADEFISKMPEGYDTIVGERGVGLSGGQRQRISLARALAMEAPVRIFDDTTSAVDMETERAIYKKLRDGPKATTIIIAQRISSIAHADKIYVIEDGRISESGSHAELVALGGYYAKTCALQQGQILDGTPGAGTSGPADGDGVSGSAIAGSAEGGEPSGS
ncbi:MAG: ABC transporter ATP-binding protein/permease [Clostridiales bacterium]|nr:ABC transporter ATP-binding protein/permease [Clostridiales bacterium]